MSAPALSLILAIASAASAESFKSWVARGAREERERDFASAARSYSSAISSWKESDGKPARAKTFCARGALREKAGEDAEALKDYSECLAIDQKNAKVFHRRGLLRMKSGDTTLALDDFYQAVKADMKFAQAYADRGRAYESQGERIFAREDHQRACDLGLKTACVRAKELAAPKGSDKKREPAAPSAETPPTTATEPKPVPSPPPKPKLAPAPATMKPQYLPRFGDCLRGLERCAESGQAYGTCVEAAPSCEKKAARGCCPKACLDKYRLAVGQGRSEAAAYRDHFSSGASCAVPPKAKEADAATTP